MATQQHLFEIRPQDCSRAAHERIRECKETVRLQILAFARESGTFGITPDETAAKFQCAHNHTSPRVSELLGDGRLVRSSRRRLTRSGCMAAVLILGPERHRDDG
jgi:hypothetical protein